MSSAVGHEEFVLLAIPDMNGSLRGKALRPAAFDAAVQHGTVMTDLIIGLDPVDTPITDYERFGIRTGAADLLLTPDADTVRELTWRPGWRICLATPRWPDGSDCDFASREVFRTVVGDVSSLGYDVMAAIEYEVRIWDEHGEPLSSGISYSLNEIGRYDRFVDALVGALRALDVELSAVHTEAGPGLLELNLAPGRGLAAADGAVLAKFATKQVAASMGLRASFLAKTVPGEEGSSGHVHLSCWDGETNVFAGSAADDPLPDPLGRRDRRRAGAPAGRVAPAESHDQLVQAARPGLVRADQRDLGLREPVVRRARDPLGPPRALAVRVPTARAPTRTPTSRSPRSPPRRRTGCGGRSSRRTRSRATPTREPISPSCPAPSRRRSRRSLRTTPSGTRWATGFSEYYATSRAWELKAWRETVTDWERDRYDRSV